MQENRTSAEEADLSLIEMLSIIYRYRWGVFAVTLLAVALSGLMAWKARPVYRAELLLLPISASNPSSSVAGLSGQLGGFASFAGINIQDGSSKAEALATLKSYDLLSTFIKDLNLTERIIYANEIPLERNIEVVKKDTLWKATRILSYRILTLVEDKKTGLVTVAIEWYEPQEAAAWVNQIVDRADRQLRNSAIEDANFKISYLRKMLQETTEVEVRESIYKSIEQQLKSVIAAKGIASFSFKVIDRAVAPEDKVRPKRKAMILLGTSAGFVMACFGFLCWGIHRRYSQVS